MLVKKIALASLFLAVPVVALAQGSGSVRRTEDAFSVTRSVKGTIVEIDVDKGLIRVEDKKGKQYAAKVDGKTLFKADKKTELAKLAAAKELGLRHFEKGQPVKLTFRTADLTATELKLRRN